MIIQRIPKDFDFNLEKKQVVAALGQFDGLHEAHQVLIKTAVIEAKKKNLLSAVITFDPHPDFVLKKQFSESYLTPLDLKIKYLEDLAIDYLFIIEFDPEVASLSHQDFVQKYLLALGVVEAVIGFDFRYGHYGLGNKDTLQVDSRDQIIVHIIDEIKYENEKIGSSLVRKLISDGKMEEVKTLLGRYYEIEGVVIDGSKFGRKLNLPTANINLRDDYVHVLSGVYATIVAYSNNYYIGLSNIGHNPSFNQALKRRLEVHLIDFAGDLYGETLRIIFVKRLRDEMKFASVEAFQKAVSKDKKQTIEIIEPIIKQIKLKKQKAGKS